MNINLANIDFCPGGKSATLTETTAEILLTETEKVILPPEGTDGFNKVTITHAPVEESVSATITENGTHTITPSEGFGAMLGVNVDVNVSSGDKIQYFDRKPTADDAGLKAIGWTDDDVNHYKYNNYAYPWEADNYKVSDANKQIVINSKRDIKTYKNNPDFKYCPMFDTSAENDMTQMFSGYTSLTSIPQLDTHSVTKMYGMFSGCTSLTSIPQLDTHSVTKMRSMFNNCKSLTSIPQLDTQRVTDMGSMFSSCKFLNSIPQLDTRSVTEMGYMFLGCNSLTSIPLLDTSSVTDMSCMFLECESLTTIPLLDTHSVTDMHNMFSKCESLTSIPQLDTSNVTSMYYMFSNCKSLTSIPQLDTRSVTNMGYMFSDCESLTSIPQLDTHSVTDMNNMFFKCSSLTSIPQLDTINVTDMSYMLFYCSSLTSVSRLDATSLTNAEYMFGYDGIPLDKFTDFGGMTNLKLDLDLSPCIALTHDSLMNVINEAADVTASPKTLTLGADNLAKLTDDEKAIATNKGWTLK